MSTVVVVVVTLVDVVIDNGLPLVVMLHSSVKSASVPGTVQSNLATHENGKKLNCDSE